MNGRSAASPNPNPNLNPNPNPNPNPDPDPDPNPNPNQEEWFEIAALEVWAVGSTTYYLLLTTYYLLLTTHCSRGVGGGHTARARAAGLHAARAAAERVTQCDYRIMLQYESQKCFHTVAKSAVPGR